ncbi:Hypothetical predicted protein [Cloeon dipterum]|uniref:Uncharacterized protein n=1 Tax=Cloeon dipterum TaxID=197152 RepID=A0A8S1C0Z5_9INSE|nr:Hypothetical predicted protein [Cloeon dipterum]
MHQSQWEDHFEYFVDISELFIFERLWGRPNGKQPRPVKIGDHNEQLVCSFADGFGGRNVPHVGERGPSLGLVRLTRTPASATLVMHLAGL